MAEHLAEVRGTQTMFADGGGGSGRTYRVRALNEAGIPGVWSKSASQVTYRQASPPLNVRAVANVPGEVGYILGAVVGRRGDRPSPTTRRSGRAAATGGWNNACRSDNASDLSCIQTGIPSGETRYYRVAAQTARGTGAWSDLAVATTRAGVPDAPTLSASRVIQGSGAGRRAAISS